MGERQARPLLAPARPDIRLAPHHLHGHSAPAGYPCVPRPAVLPEDGVYLRQSPGQDEVPAIYVLDPARRIDPELEPNQAKTGPKIQDSAVCMTRRWAMTHAPAAGTAIVFPCR